MDLQTAERALHSFRADYQSDPETAAKVRRAQEAVHARAEGVDQRGLIEDLPITLRSHAEQLRTYAGAAAFFNEGWTPMLVDLTRVCAFQPQVFLDSAAERVAGASKQDPASIARISLPAQDRVETVSPTFDQQRNAWSVASANPNLRVVGNFAGPLPVPNTPPGAFSLGFFLSLLPSFMQVARFQGRYFLRDGYHRAIGFLASGINLVPAFVTDISVVERLVPAGMLPQAAYLGPRPPTLRDYLDDSVAATVQAPATQKLILVQALELNV
jgi:hypothetical protein